MRPAPVADTALRHSAPRLRREEAPREVRFACGHALVCNSCLPVVVGQYKKCPTCDRPFGAQPVAERGAHVRVAPTFVLPK